MIPISKPLITEAEKKAVEAVLDSGMLAQGARTQELENRFAAVAGTDYAVAASSGTTALHLAMLAHGLGPGDEVITTPFTFIASVNSILFVGARPVFVDIQEGTFNLDPSQVAGAVTPKTKALLPVHLYGHPCDMDPLLELAAEADLTVIEDAAQAVGARYKGRPMGSFGTGIFSLYATKNVMAGEGGMITTDDPEIADRCRILRNHGMRQRYHHEILGYNFRMSDLHAAIGLAQLDRLEEFSGIRRKNAAFLSENLTSVRTPDVAPWADPVWHQYTVRVMEGSDRDQAVGYLNGQGVGTGIFYPIPAHRQPHIRDVVGEVELPVSERLAGEVLSLPVHPALTDQDLELIVEVVNSL